MKKSVCAIFDIGKTNKKAFLFDESYQLVWEKSATLPETTDEDGDPCEDIHLLTKWVLQTWENILQLTDFEAKAVNFSTYGASFVYLDAEGQPLTPLYNYLKAYPADLHRQFYNTYGGEETLAVKLASPVLGSLNSGMQLYRLKYEQPEVFEQVAYCLHLPQYLRFLLTQQACTDITSVGCHTNLWDFTARNYHPWITYEKIDSKIPTLAYCESVAVIQQGDTTLKVGTGLHDSSSALIPYLINFHEPFVLLSTGTWCISLNPFNDSSLTFEELQYDCLCYLTYQEKPVKASRLFAGYEHEIQTKRLAEHFGVEVGHYKEVSFDAHCIQQLRERAEPIGADDKFTLLKNSPFALRDLSSFSSYAEAYHQLMLDIMRQQLISTELVLHHSPVKRIFVDGGFSKNPIFMNLLAEAFPQIEVFAASMAQASALGAALAIHAHWNPKPLPNTLIDLKFYASPSFS